ncbi:DUF599 domain-containing protein [Colwellia sp. E2M01]|uniref:DUF599 domain-containing protein n=1 Tax=Colwellia sp. E2M01 TaxID=2841561 RepID=UPI001C0822E4|nr:DUF599 domain-containing protein [Colwellia sp. E2M01]MBU2871497.1 DUF599 domain-containing protein [Colwellia sp. E2M01]
MPFSLIDILALLTFISLWYGYSVFARKKAKTTDCIAYTLQQHRIQWMQEIITREARVSDTNLLANLERNIAFFASSTLLILAGIFTLFAQVETLERVIASLPFAVEVDHLAIQLKLAVLSIIFVISFFQFTWSMRQYGFVNVMIGAAPSMTNSTKDQENIKAYAKEMAVVQDQAAHSYNYGLRSYYFALAEISWFLHPILFVGLSLWVVFTLYTREFNSRAVKAMTKAKVLLHQQTANLNTSNTKTTLVNDDK